MSGIPSIRTERRSDGTWRALGYNLEAPVVLDTTYWSRGATEEQAVANLRRGLEKMKAARKRKP
jgi:hypothetical protein